MTTTGTPASVTGPWLDDAPWSGSVTCTSPTERYVSDLPLIDEDALGIGASVDVVWENLVHAIEGGFSRPVFAAYARAIGCNPAATSGPRPLREGSTIPGFGVAVAVAGSVLALQGAHRFSAYDFTLRLDPTAADRSRLRAESRAIFPGVSGGAYRLLVVGTHGHALAVRRLLRGIKQRSEAQSVGSIRRRDVSRPVSRPRARSLRELSQWFFT